MRFTIGKFIMALVVTFFVGSVVVAGLRAFGVIGKPAVAAGDPAQLIQSANAALEAVSRRQPGERRPASFDAVLAPLDGLLRHARDLIESDSFDPVRDYDKVRALALPVVDIATRADQQAKTETGFMTKEYRFNSQKAEACQYLAATLWERINRTLPQSSGFFNEATPYPPGQMSELMRILDDGVQADPENADLFYTRGVVNRAQGLFAAAARDLQQAVGLNADLTGAWNTLGLVRINLKEFDKAEEALERAKASALKQAKDFNLSDPGAEYTAILYNLATFHEGLATFYNRENRVTPTVEYQRATERHSAEARRYFQEFLTREPSTSADAQNARAKMQGLP